MHSNQKTSNPSIDEVRDFIEKEIMRVKELGMTELVVRSGEIHKALKMSRALPTVCSAMRTLKGDFRYEILEEPPKGNGSRLVFKYII